MIGSSRASLALVTEEIDRHYSDPQLSEAGRDLLQVTDLLGREHQLRSSLSDGGRPVAERRAVLQQLLQGKVDDLALQIAITIGSQRWSSDSDLVDACEYAAAQCLFSAAERAGDLDAIEEELFRFGRLVVSQGELQLALTSPALPPANKASILADLLEDKASPETVELLSFVAGHLRGRRLDSAIEVLTGWAAQRRGTLQATVTVAGSLDQDQLMRLGEALRRLYGQAVSMNIEIDRSVIGGIAVQIGDDLIDGTISGRLEDARRRISG